MDCVMNFVMVRLLGWLSIAQARPMWALGTRIGILGCALHQLAVLRMAAITWRCIVYSLCMPSGQRGPPLFLANKPM